jgi:hypothetical protein
MTANRNVIGGAILRGAYARWWGRETLADNPFPDLPGYFVLRRAWSYGFENSDDVLAEHDQGERVTAR